MLGKISLAEANDIDFQPNDDLYYAELHQKPQGRITSDFNTR